MATSPGEIAAFNTIGAFSKYGQNWEASVLCCARGAEKTMFPSAGKLQKQTEIS